MKNSLFGLLFICSALCSIKTKAVLSKDVPEDIITNPKSSQRIENYYGISGQDLNKDQKYFLKILVEEYVHNFEHHGTQIDFGIG